MLFINSYRGARYLTGEKLQDAENSKLGRIALLHNKSTAHTQQLLELKTWTRFYTVS